MSSRFVDLSHLDDDDDFDNNNYNEEVEPIGVEINYDVVDIADFYDSDSDEYAEAGEAQRQQQPEKEEDSKKNAAARTTEKVTAAATTTTTSTSTKGEKPAFKPNRNNNGKRKRENPIAATSVEAHNSNNSKEDPHATVANNSTGEQPAKKKRRKRGGKRGGRERRSKRERQQQQQQQQQQQHKQQHKQQQQRDPHRGSAQNEWAAANQNHPRTNSNSKKEISTSRKDAVKQQLKSNNHSSIHNEASAGQSKQKRRGKKYKATKQKIKAPSSYNASFETANKGPPGTPPQKAQSFAPSPSSEEHISIVKKVAPTGAVGKEALALRAGSHSMKQSPKAKQHDNSGSRGLLHHNITAKPDGRKGNLNSTLKSNDHISSTSGKSAHKVQSQVAQGGQSIDRGVNRNGDDDGALVAETIEICRSTLQLKSSIATNQPPKAAARAHGVTSAKTVTSRLPRPNACTSPSTTRMPVLAEKDVEVVNLLDSDSDEEEATAKPATKAEGSRSSSSDVDKSELLKSGGNRRENPPANVQEPSTGATGLPFVSACLKGPPLSTATEESSSHPKAKNSDQMEGCTASIKKEDIDSNKFTDSNPHQPKTQNNKSECMGEPNLSACRNFIVIDSSDDESDFIFIDSSDDESDGGECYVTAVKPRPKANTRGNCGSSRGSDKRCSSAKPNTTKRTASNPAYRRSQHTDYVFSVDRDYDWSIGRQAAAEIQDRLFQETVERLRSKGTSSSNNNSASASASTRNRHEETPQFLSAPLLDIPRRYPNHWKWRDPYARLGLPNQAPASLVKSHYRKLALLYHPDKLKFEDSAERFHAITAAYRKLTS